MKLQKAGLLGIAVTYVRSERGQRTIKQLQAKYDTPATRARVRQTVAGLRSRAGR